MFDTSGWSRGRLASAALQERESQAADAEMLGVELAGVRARGDRCIAGADQRNISAQSRARPSVCRDRGCSWDIGQDGREADGAGPRGAAEPARSLAQQRWTKADVGYRANSRVSPFSEPAAHRALSMRATNGETSNAESRENRSHSRRRFLCRIVRPRHVDITRRFYRSGRCARRGANQLRSDQHQLCRKLK